MSGCRLSSTHPRPGCDQTPPSAAALVDHAEHSPPVPPDSARIDANEVPFWRVIDALEVDVRYGHSVGPGYPFRSGERVRLSDLAAWRTGSATSTLDGQGRWQVEAAEQCRVGEQ